jgi:hypothetical protein
MIGDDNDTHPVCPLFSTGYAAALPFVYWLELLSELVIAHATGIDDGVWGQKVLGERVI